MVRRVFFTVAALLLAASAFCGADPQPDINLFGVLFLFFAFVVWFCWGDIEAGYAYLDDSGMPRSERIGLTLVRFAPMYLRDLTGRKRGKA
jgi:hypothetical protein